MLVLGKIRESEYSGIFLRIMTSDETGKGGHFMTKLDCTVTTCVHNAEKCCCKSGSSWREHRRRTAVIPAAEALRRTGAVFLRIFLRRRNQSLRWNVMWRTVSTMMTISAGQSGSRSPGTALWLSVRRNVQALGRSRNKKGLAAEKADDSN